MNKLIKKIVAGVSIGILVLYTVPINAFASTESVYSKLDSKGESYRNIVSIKNDEEVNQKDSDKDLPIECIVNYKLDGNDIKAEELVGKSGKVSINIKYINKSSKIVNINGVNETMYTPFVVAIGTLIDNENNKNIEVSNGKVIENGAKSIVCGVLLPGLEDSLKLNSNLINLYIPSSLEITMDSTNFEMNNVMSYASPKVLDTNINWTEFNNLFDSANLLQNSSNQLEEGAKKLEEGASKIKEGSNQLSNGIETAYNGSNEIKKQIGSSISAMENNRVQALDDSVLNKIGNNAATTANENVKKQLDGIGNSAKLSATKTIEGKLDEIGKDARAKANSSIEVKKETIASKAEQTAKVTIESKENELFEKIQGFIEKNKSSLISAEKVSQAATKTVSEGATNIVKKSVVAGATAGSESAKAAIEAIKSNTGNVEPEVSGISVKVDYKKVLNSNKKYSKLNDEQKAVVDEVIKEITNSVEKDAEEQAKLQAKNSSKKAIEIASKNAESSAKQSAQLAVKEITMQSATVAAKTAAECVTTQIIQDAVNAGVNNAVSQLMSNLSSNAAIIENEVLPYVGQIAVESARAIAGEVAENTAKETAKQVAEGVAFETAKQVAVQITNTVACNTAKTVASNVADGVQAEATKQIKNKMQTLLDEGITPLTNGLDQINTGAKELNNGTVKLENGAKELSVGMSKFNKDGIQKISKLINGDLNNLVLRGKKLEQLSNEYNSFDSENKQENVKFISIIDSVKASKMNGDNEEIRKKE